MYKIKFISFKKYGYVAGFCSSFGTLRSHPAKLWRLQTPLSRIEWRIASVSVRREQFLFKNGIMVVWTVASASDEVDGERLSYVDDDGMDTCPSKGMARWRCMGKSVTDKHSPLQLAFGSCCTEYTFRAEARPFLVNFIDFLDGLCPLYVAMIMFLFSTRVFEGCSHVAGVGFHLLHDTCHDFQDLIPHDKTTSSSGIPSFDQHVSNL